MRAYAIAMLVTGLAVALPAPASAVVKTIWGQNCKLFDSPNFRDCGKIDWDFDDPRYQVNSVTATARWEGQVSVMRGTESVFPTTETQFGSLHITKSGGSGGASADIPFGEDISDTPATTKKGSFTYSITTTSETPRTRGWAARLSQGGTYGYLSKVKLMIDYTILPTSGTPEPGAWLLLIIGFGLTGVQLRRRRLSRTV